MALVLGSLLLLSEPSRVASSEASAAAAPGGAAAPRARDPLAAGAACVDQVCDVSTPACAARVFHQMRCLLGDNRPLRVPSVTLADPAGMASVTSHRSGSRVRSELRRAALQLLTLDTQSKGSHPREGRAGDEPSARRTPLGFYSYQDQHIYILDTPQKDEGNAAYLALVHEMVHAIQDGDGGLSARSREPRSYDAELGEEAAMEGEARYYTQLVRAHLNQRWTDDLRTGFAAEPPAADKTALREPAIARSSARRFAEAYGAYFAANDGEFRARFSTGDATAVGAVATSPLLQKRHDWPRAPYASRSTCARRSAGYSAVHEDSVGPWIIQALFNRAAQSTTVGAGVAKQVRGDWLGLYSTARSEIFVIWRLDLQSEAAVRQAAHILRTGWRAAHAESGSGTGALAPPLRIIETGNVLTLIGGTASTEVGAVIATCA
jgi:hypothetical protein